MNLETALVFIAAWLALSRTKTGWMLVLLLCGYEFSVMSLYYGIVDNSYREPFIPLIIACLLCSPAVFRWYFPKQKEAKPVCCE